MSGSPLSSGRRQSSWKRRRSENDFMGDAKSPNTKRKKSESVLSPRITSYFSPSSKQANVPGRSYSDPKTTIGNPNLTKSNSNPSLASSLSKSSENTSLQTTQVIDLDSDGDIEIDSQATDVLEQLEPLFLESLDPQTASLSTQDLYFSDNLDEFIQNYDTNAVHDMYNLRKSQKLKKISSSQQISSPPSSQQMNSLSGKLTSSNSSCIIKAADLDMEESNPTTNGQELESSTQIETPAVNAYYLSNFMAILDVVEQKDKHLFSKQELEVFSLLRNSQRSEQQIFSRLLYRKGPWFQVSKIVYQDIKNISKSIDSMIQRSLLEQSQNVLDILPNLSNSQLRGITKSPSSFKRNQLLDHVTKWVSSQKTLDGQSIRIPKDIGKCVRIPSFVDILFKRVHRLFFLNQAEDQTTLMMIHTGKVKFPTYLVGLANSHLDDSISYELSVIEDGPTPPSSPYQLTQNSRSGTVDEAAEELENVRTLLKIGFRSVFQTRADLDDYELALEQSHRIAELIGAEIDVENDTTDNEKRAKQTPHRKNLDDDKMMNIALGIVEEAVIKFKMELSIIELNDEAQIQSPDQKFDGDSAEIVLERRHPFLRRFSAFWVYSSIIWVGVSILERQKKYEQCVDYLKMLLGQKLVNSGRRGEWWIRLAFNAAHLKRNEDSIQYCIDGINDSNCRSQHLLKLYDKLRIELKIKERQKVKIEKKNASKGQRKGFQKGKGKMTSPVAPLEQNEDEVNGMKTPIPKRQAKRSPNSIVQDTDEDTEVEEIDEGIKLESNAKKQEGLVDSPSKFTLAGFSPAGDSSLHEPSSTSSPQPNKTCEMGLDLVPLPAEFESGFKSKHLEVLQSINQLPVSSPSGAPSTPVHNNWHPYNNEISSTGSSPVKSESSHNSNRSPQIRYTSPVRYRTYNGAYPSPPEAYLEVDEDEYQNLKSKDPLAAIFTEEFLQKLVSLGVPVPEPLHPGTIESITGPTVKKPGYNGYGAKTSFVGMDGNLCGVEEFSIQYYQFISEEKWPCATHCEGSAYSALFALLFWDILFDASVPYVFQTPYQDAPLDLTTSLFYTTRRRRIDERLSAIYNAPQTESSFVARKIEDSYYKWRGRACRGIDWAHWKIRDLLDIARCLGGPVLSILCERFCVDYRFTHSGLPDLLLWNPSENKAKLVEVKGPNDKLSEKQKIWIDVLARRGCNIVTLYVKKAENTAEGGSGTKDEDGLMVLDGEAGEGED